MKEIMTKSGKPVSQVLEEARKFCELNESPKTFENIRNILSGDWVKELSERFSASEIQEVEGIHSMFANMAEDELKEEFIKRTYLVKHMPFSKHKPFSNICAEGERGVPEYVQEEIQEIAIDIAMTIKIDEHLIKQ